MTGHNIIFFDLDGTLTDPKIGITKSVQYALSKFGIIEDNLDRLEVFIGPPLMDSFMEFYSFSEEDSKLAIKYYRERFSVTGLYENKVYPGIDMLLKDLKAAGRKLIVATSKPTVFSEKILKHFNLYNYFDAVDGSELDGTRVQKYEVIEFAIKNLGNKSIDNIIMVGDRKHDIIGAKKNGLSSIGVTYGYGSFDELKSAGADYIVHSVQELRELLI